MEIALLGHMGRDEAASDRLKHHKLHIIGQWENPGLVDKATETGGQFHIVDSIKNVDAIAETVKQINPDMFFTNFDDALAAGVVDKIKQIIPELLIPCPDQAAARVEWDKFLTREIVEGIDPKYNPINRMVSSPDAANEAIDYFKSLNIEIAIKPRNLSGGKGVQVMGKHFYTFIKGEEYALKVLADPNQTGIEIQEKLEGHEFTLQIFTDGSTIIKPPTTYDYPYREDGDKGPGTGGMGTFSMKDGLLPFVSQEDYDESIDFMACFLEELKKRGLKYKGVLYPTFFKTPNGLRLVEINARGGDPELINIIDLMEDDVDYGEVLRQIATGELSEDSVRFKKLASTMIYLVAPEYGKGQGRPYEFSLDQKAATANGIRLRFAAAERIGKNRYRTVGSSRSVGLSALADTPWEGKGLIDDAIKRGFGDDLPLHRRKNVGDKDYIGSLT
jgi:phosphoribosylamine--glycine ligase